MNNYKIGDVVILKSGGPPMTIHDIGDYSHLGMHPGLLCIWFDGPNRCEEVFHPAVVEEFSNGSDG